MFIALDVPMSWNPAKMDLVAMQYKLLAQLRYFVTDLLASGKRCGNGGIAIHGGGMEQKVVQLREL
jgi:hypothetical protein